MLSPKNDPWRGTMGLNLRSEASKFILTVFNLDVFSDQAQDSPAAWSEAATGQHFAERFARFLASEPAAHSALDHRRFISLRVPKSVTDVLLCEYAPDGELMGIVPVFDNREPVLIGAPEVTEAVRTVIAVFNQTRKLPESKRPQALARGVSGTGSAAAGSIAARLLAGTAVSFQPGSSPPEGQFIPPDFRLHRGLGVGYMTARCRRSPDGRGIDLWLQCHHAGEDGGPVQEMLGRLQVAWGLTSPVILPADDGKAPGPPTICNFAGERSVGLLIDFVDFAPLAELRRELASSLAAQVETVPVAGLLIWCLSHQPEFTGLGIGTAVDVPPEGNHHRAVDLVTIWPTQYHGRPDGFVAFLRDLLRLFAQARVRQSPTWKSMRDLNSLPPLGSWALLRFRQDVARKAFGTLTLSLVRGSNMFIAPMPDSAWDHGFITIGNMGVPCQSGPPVTPVSIKGDPLLIQAYPAALRRAIAQCRDYVT